MQPSSRKAWPAAHVRRRAHSPKYAGGYAGGYARRVRLAYDDAGRGECVVLIHGHPFDETEFSAELGAFLRAHAP